MVVMNRLQFMRHNPALPRFLRGVFGALIVALVASLVFGVSGASAGRTWCSKDPLFQVGDDVVDVTIASYTDMLNAATGRVKIVLTVPDGVSAQPHHRDGGFGYGYDITYQTSKKLVNSATAMQITVAVYAPASDGTLPVRIDVRSTSGPKQIYQASATGAVNSWVSLTTT
jgi:hypothetical protein